MKKVLWMLIAALLPVLIACGKTVDDKSDTAITAEPLGISADTKGKNTEANTEEKAASTDTMENLESGQSTVAQTSAEQETETPQQSFPVDSVVSADADDTDMMELTEEEKLLKEKMDYYRESAYYDDIMYYWEKARGVTDISHLIVPLYSSDRRYLTKENLAYDPPVVIHLAKNEIYARHGYIFQNEDLYNYFMGCLWYTPTTLPENFDETVFNEYEIENLKLLAELDSL